MHSTAAQRSAQQLKATRAADSLSRLYRVFLKLKGSKAAHRIAPQCTAAHRKALHGIARHRSAFKSNGPEHGKKRLITLSQEKK